MGPDGHPAPAAVLTMAGAAVAEAVPLGLFR
jgi:hypothetical protein